MTAKYAMLSFKSYVHFYDIFVLFLSYLLLSVLVTGPTIYSSADFKNLGIIRGFVLSQTFPHLIRHCLVKNSDPRGILLLELKYSSISYEHVILEVILLL